MTTRNDKTHSANDDILSENWEIKTKRFSGKKGMLHTSPKIVNGKKIMLHTSPKMVNEMKGTLHASSEMDLCFRCLREGHNQNDCTRNVSCYHCKRKEHPTASCKTWHRSQQGKEENHVGETHTQTIRTVAAIATPEQQERDKTVLLLSTFVEIRGDAPHTETIKVPVIFDVGSERSFITEEIVQQLGIEITHKEPLVVDGFGGTHTTHCTSARAKLKVKRTDGRFFTMFANSVPRLVSEVAIAKLTGKNVTVHPFNAEHHATDGYTQAADPRGCRLFPRNLQRKCLNKVIVRIPFDMHLSRRHD
uniref:CCHC-type domain-containing protein n=1 Tax=Parascaris univalens TaxID=6257 RepID=A0A914ZIR1_PARUN